MDGTIIFFWIFISPIVGAAIGRTRNNAAMGAILGLLFGPLGWLLALLDDKRAQCPQCKGRVPDGATKCLHCGSEFSIPAGYEVKKVKQNEVEAYKKWKASQPSGETPPGEEPH